jgi:hypothetical protein
MLTVIPFECHGPQKWAIQLTHHGFCQLQLDGLLLQAMTPRVKRQRRWFLLRSSPMA